MYIIMFVRVRVCVSCALHVFLGLSCTIEVATCAATQWSQNTPNPHVFLQESGSADKSAESSSTPTCQSGNESTQTARARTVELAS